MILQIDTLVEKIEYSALGSTKLSKDKSVISLYGKARLNCKNFSISGDEIVYNKDTKKIAAKNFTITNNYNKLKKTGTYGEFHLNDNIK